MACPGAVTAKALVATLPPPTFPAPTPRAVAVAPALRLREPAALSLRYA
jgi:hypothetical protein